MDLLPFLWLWLHGSVYCRAGRSSHRQWIGLGPPDPLPSPSPLSDPFGSTRKCALRAARLAAPRIAALIPGPCAFRPL
uniref:Putative secreted peptide n=1 Tax=Anopheles braziliensis TaxID=58242 RepID=A0A2M3ZUD3_9DIPT